MKNKQQILKEFQDSFFEFTDSGTFISYFGKKEDDLDIIEWLSKIIDEVEEESIKELEEKWDKAIDILYCEHCGKLITKKQSDDLKIEELKK